MITPTLKYTRRAYHQPPFADAEYRGRFERLLGELTDLLGANREGSSSYCADDTMVWLRSLAFLRDPRFEDALRPHAAHAALRARAWRLYTTCWAAASSASQPGDYLDVGCYNGLAADIAFRYVGAPAWQHQWYLYDWFDPPPGMPRKRAHGPGLADDVRRLFAERPATVVAGAVPDTLSRHHAIAFMNVDLNDPAAECAVLEQVFDRVGDGGLIVLDDYGDAAYDAGQRQLDRFFATHGHSVYECPTGQGLVVKRCGFS